MKKVLDQLNLSHHAYCLIGGEATVQELKETLEKKYKVKIQGNSDFYARNYETFNIDDARQVKALADSRPVTVGGKKFFVLEMNAITVEAQNALLKLLEEPAEYTHFFLILPSAHLLLPTIKSRISFISEGSKAQGGRDIGSTRDIKDDITSAKDFLSAPVAKRLELIKKLMEDVTKEKRPKQDAIDLLGALEELVHARAKDLPGAAAGLKKNLPQLEAITLARKYATDRAPSLKMLLEYVAISV